MIKKIIFFLLIMLSISVNSYADLESIPKKGTQLTVELSYLEGTGHTGFKIYRDNHILVLDNIPPAARTIVIPRVLDYRIHVYYMTATFATGESSPSNNHPVEANKLTPVLFFAIDSPFESLDNTK